MFGWGHVCIDCTVVRDNRGRFVDRETSNRYRLLLKRSLGYDGVSHEEMRAARRELSTFWQETPS